MKANQNVRTRMDDEGAMGIGAMIVFIAMVIVAAVAAAVLINTAGNLQRKSLETGKETTQEVAANLFVRDIVGYTNATSATTREIMEVYFYISLAPGAEAVDLNQLVIRWKHNSNLEDVQINTTDATNCDDAVRDDGGDYAALQYGFCIRDVKDGGDGDTAILSEGDRVRLEVVLDDIGGERIGERDSVDALLLPEVGSPVTASFKTPATYGNQLYHSLL